MEQSGQIRCPLFDRSRNFHGMDASPFLDAEVRYPERLAIQRG